MRTNKFCSVLFGVSVHWYRRSRRLLLSTYSYSSVEICWQHSTLRRSSRSEILVEASKQASLFAQLINKDIISMNNIQGQAARKAHKAQHCWPSNIAIFFIRTSIRRPNYWGSRWNIAIRFGRKKNENDVDTRGWKKFENMFIRFDSIHVDECDERQTDERTPHDDK